MDKPLTLAWIRALRSGMYREYEEKREHVFLHETDWKVPGTMFALSPFGVLCETYINLYPGHLNRRAHIDEGKVVWYDYDTCYIMLPWKVSDAVMKELGITVRERSDFATFGMEYTMTFAEAANVLEALIVKSEFEPVGDTGNPVG